MYINDNLYAQAKAIFEQQFIDLETIPDGWKKGNLLDIANYLNGLAMQKYRPNEDEVGLSVLKIKELRQGSCDNSSELCSPNIKPEYIIHDGDVIFSWSGSLLVDIWCGGTCGLNQHLFKVTSNTYPKPGLLLRRHQRTPPIQWCRGAFCLGSSYKEARGSAPLWQILSGSLWGS